LSLVSIIISLKTPSALKMLKILSVLLHCNEGGKLKITSAKLEWFFYQTCQVSCYLLC